MFLWYVSTHVQVHMTSQTQTITCKNLISVIVCWSSWNSKNYLYIYRPWRQHKHLSDNVIYKISLTSSKLNFWGLMAHLMYSLNAVWMVLAALSWRFQMRVDDTISSSFLVGNCFLNLISIWSWSCKHSCYDSSANVTVTGVVTKILSCLFGGMLYQVLLILRAPISSRILQLGSKHPKQCIQL